MQSTIMFGGYDLAKYTPPGSKEKIYWEEET
jgi:hypothetical protein